MLEKFARATAIGAVAGFAASAVVTWMTAGLWTQPGKALLLAGPIVALHVVLLWGATATLALLTAVAERLGAPRGCFTSPRFLWGIALALAGLITLNHLRRSVEWIDALTLPLRLVLIAGTLYLLVDALRKARPSTHRVRRAEQLGAVLLIPTLVLGGLYLGRGRGGEVRTVSAEDVIALAPTFAPEPEDSLQPFPDRPRVLVLGLDGADWKRIERGVEAGRMPTFERLMREGRTAPLETLRPTYSPAIWTSMMTGVPPAVHGIDTFYMFQIPRLGVQRLDMPRGLDHVETFLTVTGELVRIPVTSSLRRRKAIWNLTDEAGMGTAVVGLWATWPPEPLANGLVISDHASLARRQEWLDREKTSTLTAGTTTYPPELEERFAAAQRPPASVTREELGEFLDVDDAVWADFQETLAFSKDVDISAFRSSHLNDEFYLTAATEIWQEERPDLMVVYAKAIDQLSHFFYEMGTPEAPGLGHSAEQIERYGGVVDRIYAWTDRKIAPLVELAASDPNTLLLIVSDHGWEQEKDGGYNHSYAPPGILILFGADVCTSDCAPLPEVSIYDVAPTVLERLGLPLSDEFVGAPIPAFRSPNPTSTVAMYGPPLGEGGVIQSDLDQEMLEKLRALGYIE